MWALVAVNSVAMMDGASQDPGNSNEGSNTTVMLFKHAVFSATIVSVWSAYTGVCFQLPERKATGERQLAHWASSRLHHHSPPFQSFLTISIMDGDNDNGGNSLQSIFSPMRSNLWWEVLTSGEGWRIVTHPYSTTPETSHTATYQRERKIDSSSLMTSP